MKAIARQSLVVNVVAIPIPTAASAKNKDSWVDGNVIRSANNDVDFGRQKEGWQTTKEKTLGHLMLLMLWIQMFCLVKN